MAGIIPEPTDSNTQPTPESLIATQEKPKKKKHNGAVTSLVFFGNFILALGYFIWGHPNLFFFHLIGMLLLGLVLKDEDYKHAFLFTFFATIIIAGVGIGALFILCFSALNNLN